MYLIFASVELLFIEFITVKKEDTMYLLFLFVLFYYASFIIVILLPPFLEGCT